MSNLRVISWNVNGLRSCARKGFLEWLGKSRAQLDLVWDPSCSGGASDYFVYEGTIGDWTSHRAAACTTGGALTTVVTPDGGSTYYLVVPQNAKVEGSYGTDSEGIERPESTAACVGIQDTTSCP